MIEKEILDRVPLYPGRITLNPVEGAENTYDMVRADSPRVEGTPINKATLDSITQSRLTGRYYPVTVTRAIAQSTPIDGVLPPVGGWTVDSTGKVATKNLYRIEASSISVSDYSIEKSVDGKDETSWSSADGTLHTFTMQMPYQIKATSLRASIGRAGTASFKWQLRGSNDNATWVNLTPERDYTSEINVLISSPGDYSYYQMRFVLGSYSSGQQSRAYIKEIALRDITVNTYNNVITAEGMPSTWTKGQRVTIQVPEFSSYVTAANTFMGITCNTILQPNKRYELVYNGSTFDAKEV